MHSEACARQRKISQQAGRRSEVLRQAFPLRQEQDFCKYRPWVCTKVDRDNDQKRLMLNDV